MTESPKTSHAFNSNQANSSESLLIWLNDQCESNGKSLIPGKHLGLDIGGANLKSVALEVEHQRVEITSTTSTFFPLWKHPDQLTQALQELVTDLGGFTDLGRYATVSVTMTGEIADCFASKTEGVNRIVAATQAAFSECDCNLAFYSQVAVRRSNTVLSHFVTFPQSKQLTSEHPESTPESTQWLAASNWHAVARLVAFWMTGRSKSGGLKGDGLVVDLGSTTCDITPVSFGVEVAAASDWQRIKTGQLLYTGFDRSPLSCLVPSIDWPAVDSSDTSLPQSDRPAHRLLIAQELFATAKDAYLITGDLAENPTCLDTADGRPSTKTAAAQRIARCLCSDADELPTGLIQHIAERAKSNQMSTIGDALEKQFRGLETPEWTVIIGQGETLLRQTIQQRFPTIPCVDLSGSQHNHCSIVAPAFAVAALRALGG